MTFTNPEYLVETEWLEAHLGQPDLRVLDCTVIFEYGKDGIRVANGSEAWAKGHIPTSGFADVMQDLSDGTSPLPFMMAPPAQVAETMARYGVGDGTRVVLYDASNDGWAHMWAARVWWLLRVCGFDQAAVLNGGWYKWTQEGRPVSTDPCTYPPATFTANVRPELIASKDEVLAAIGARGACIVNALTPEDHNGSLALYARPGHIASSVNVPTISLVDPQTHAYLPAAELHSRFAEAGALDRERVITYCGGGIAASSDAFVLALMGVPNVAVYDGSLAEWSADPSLPMSTD